MLLRQNAWSEKQLLKLLEQIYLRVNNKRLKEPCIGVVQQQKSIKDV